MDAATHKATRSSGRPPLHFLLIISTSRLVRSPASYDRSGNGACTLTALLSVLVPTLEAIRVDPAEALRAN
jgi:hypothetical protein